MEAQIAVLTFMCILTLAQAGDYGDQCSGDSDCSGLSKGFCMKYSDCSKGYCYCKPGYAQKSNSECVKTVDLGSSCSSSSECEEGTCQSGKCACTTGYEKDGSKCEGKIGLGETTCDGSNYCRDGASCVSGKCECPASKKEEGGKCVYYEEGDDCGDGSTKYCEGALSCVSGKCACSTTGYEYVDIWQYDEKEKTCIHKDADRSVGKGKACNSKSDSSGLRCGEKKFCKACPSVNTYLCRSGADAVMVSAVLMLLTLFGATFLKL